MPIERPVFTSHANFAGPSERLPQDIRDLLGDEISSILENTSFALRSARAFITQPNPFDIPSGGPSELKLTADAKLFVQQCRGMTEASYDRPMDEGLIRPARDMAPHLAELNGAFIEVLDTSKALVVEKMNVVSKRVEDHEGEMEQHEASSGKIESLRDRYDFLTRLKGTVDLMTIIAAGMPGESNFETVMATLVAEEELFYIDAFAAGCRREPELAQKYDALINQHQPIRIPRRYRQRDTESLDIHEQILESGEKDRQVKKAHRGGPVVDDQLKVTQLDADFSDTKVTGTAIFKELISMGRRLTASFAISQADALKVASVRNSEVLKAAIAGNSDVEAAFLTALAMEANISELARELETTSTTGGLKPRKEFRLTIKGLKETPLADEIRREAKRKPAVEQKSYDDVETDPLFRKVVKVAKDTLSGGGRLAYDRARELAKNLHGVKFGEKSLTSLQPAESGMIVAILADQIESLVGAVERCRRSRKLNGSIDTSDPQVAKFKHEDAGHFLIIANFDLLAAVQDLRAVFTNPKKEEKLFNILSVVDRNKIKETLKALEDRLLAIKQSEVSA